MEHRTHSKDLVFGLIKRYIALSILFATLVCLTATIPSNLILNNAIASTAENQAAVAASKYRTDKAGGEPTYTTSIMFSILLHQDSNHPLYSAVNGLYYGTEDGTFYDFEKNAQAPADTVYAYYWHGWAVVVKPLLIAFTYSDIKRIFSFTLIVSLFILAYLLQKVSKQYGWLTAAALAASIALLRGFETIPTLPFFYAVEIGVLAACIIAYSYNKSTPAQQSWPYLLFFTTGGLTSFFDFLTTPLIAYAIPAICLVVLHTTSPNIYSNSTLTATIKLLFFTGIAWVIGYVGLWASKWILATVVLGYNVISEAINEILFRVNITDESQWAVAHNISPIRALLRNGRAAFTPPLFTLGLIFIVACIIAAAIRKPQVNASLLIGLAIIAVLPYLWYLVVSNHSQIHSYFACRNQIATIASLFIMGFHCFTAPHKERSSKLVD